MPPVFYYMLLTNWTCENFTELHYNIAEGMVIFKCILHLCWHILQGVIMGVIVSSQAFLFQRTKHVIIWWGEIKTVGLWHTAHTDLGIVELFNDCHCIVFTNGIGWSVVHPLCSGCHITVHQPGKSCEAFLQVQPFWDLLWSPAPLVAAFCLTHCSTLFISQ